MAEIRKTWTVGDQTFDSYAAARAYRARNAKSLLHQDVDDLLAEFEKSDWYDRDGAVKALFEKFNIAYKRQPK